MAKNGHQLSQPKGGKGTVKNEGVSGPIPQHKRLAMGEAVDGKTNPYGTDSAGGKASAKQKY